MGKAFQSGGESKAEFEFVYKPAFHPSGESLAFVGNRGGELDPVLLWYLGVGELLVGDIALLFSWAKTESSSREVSPSIK